MRTPQPHVFISKSKMGSDTFVKKKKKKTKTSSSNSASDRFFMVQGPYKKLQSFLRTFQGHFKDRIRFSRTFQDCANPGGLFFNEAQANLPRN